MTRRLGVTRTAYAALASVSLAGVLAAAGAIGGCGGGNGNGTGSSSGSTTDSGTDTGNSLPDTGTPPPDTGTPIPDTGLPDMGMPLPPCPSPVFSPTTSGTPPSATIEIGTNVSISAPGLAAGGYIFFTTDNSLPSDNSPIYNAGTVGIPVTANTIFHAISSTKGTTCTDSAPVEADYTVVMADGGLPIPTFAPTGTATTQNNAFQVTITDTGATDICYTLDGSTPACGSGTPCATGSTAYGGPFTLSASNTTGAAMPGQVEVQAIGCSATATGSVGKVLYTLQAATPTMQPGAGAVTYAPTLTGSFADTTTGATIYYTTDGSMPKCAGGGTQKTYGAPFALTTGTYYAIACEAGYADSAVAGPFAVSVQLPPPSLSPGAGTYNSSQSVSALNAGTYPSGTWLCYSTSASTSTTSAPACGANGACSAGGTAAVSPANGGQVQAIACAPAGYSNSNVATASPYKLQLAAPYVNPDGKNNAGAPLSSYTLPANETHPNTLVVGESLMAGAQGASWLCWAQNPSASAPPACDPMNEGQCLNNANSTGVGTVTGINAGPGSFSAGDTISVIACPDDNGGAGAGFAPSSVASLTFSGNGQATPPSISIDTTNTITVNTVDYYQQPVNAILLNSNSSPATVCYSTSGTAPTCTAGATSGGCLSLDGTNGTAQLALTYVVTGGGTGYTVPPFVTVQPNIADFGASCSGVPVATINGSGAVTGITGASCTGLTMQPVVDASQIGGGLAGTTQVTQNFTFTVTAAGTGYGAPVTTTLSGHVPNNSNAVTCTPTVTANINGNGGINSMTVDAAQLVAASCPLFIDTPTVTAIGGGNADATATVAVSATQNVAITVSNTGADYTVQPGMTLVPSSGGGACSTFTATIDPATGDITAVTASGCSGFTVDQNPTFKVTDPTPPTAPATAVAYGSNMTPVPTIQTEATTLQAVSCNAGLSTSPTASSTYHFAQPTPIIGYTATGANFNTGANAKITAANTVTIQTVSAIAGVNGPTSTAFSDTSIVYSTDPNTMPNCTGSGTSVTGSTATITLPAPGGTFSVRAVACGANQKGSNFNNVVASNGTYHVFTAQPVIATASNGVSVTTNQAGGTLNLQNLAVATITSATPNSYACYTAATGATPACGTTAGTCATNGGTAVTTFPANLNMTSGQVLKVIGCATDVSGTGIDPSTAIGGGAGIAGGANGVTYTLGISPAALITTPAPAVACPEVVPFGFDPNLVTATGPTNNATVCYSLTPIASCAAAAGVTCFSPTSGAPTTNFTSAANGATSVYVAECAAGLNTNLQTLTLTPNKSYPATSPVGHSDLSAPWASGTNLVSGSLGGLTGGFTYTGTNSPPTAYSVSNYFFATGGIPGTATNVEYYFSDGTGGNNSTTTGREGQTLPFAAQYAIVSTTGATPSASGFKYNGSAWVADTAGLTNHAAASGTSTTNMVQLNNGGDFNAQATVNVVGYVLQSGAINASWPTFNGGVGFISDGLQACQTPASGLQ